MFPCVLWLLDFCQSLRLEGVPKRKGLDIPIREMKATWPWVHGSPKGWYHGSYRLVSGLGLMDFSFVFMNQIFLDLCVFCCWGWAYVEMCWELLRYTVHMGGLSCVVGWNLQVSFSLKILLKWFLMSTLEYASGAVLKWRPRSSVATWSDHSDHSSYVYCITWYPVPPIPLCLDHHKRWAVFPAGILDCHGIPPPDGFVNSNGMGWVWVIYKCLLIGRCQ